jgi:MoaA/NifB/PqqE/SkfB family radical SAM enzyme
MSRVTCTAPLNSILIDTNKGVRPCCYYQDGFLGNINESPISEIINNDAWSKLKAQMFNNEWPRGCLLCKSNEESFGNSLRKVYLESIPVDDFENVFLNHLEIVGSNICNLACVHCHSLYSSKWHIERQRAIKLSESYSVDKKTRIFKLHPIKDLVDDANGSLRKIHLPNPKLMVENLKVLDLSKLRTISFRGGEPFLNSETQAVLAYADSIGLLDTVDVSITTNGTYVDEEIVELLKKCKSVHINLSIDGIGDLFNYIRYGDAKFESIEPTIEKLNKVPNIGILVSVASMNYNAFNLIEIRDWTIEMSKKYNKVQRLAGFNNCVVIPNYLSLTTLSDVTRKHLIELYKVNSLEDEFKYVINLLSNEYAGHTIHSQWVEYTELMQTIRKNNIVDIVPQLASELGEKL